VRISLHSRKHFRPGVASGNRYPDAQLVHMDSEKHATA
jgi:hypothetical protein